MEPTNETNEKKQKQQKKSLKTLWLSLSYLFFFRVISGMFKRKAKLFQIKKNM